MEAENSCCFLHTYSELAGLQKAYTLRYCARSAPQGVLLEIRRSQAGAEQAGAALCVGASFEQMERIMLYLCENSIGLDSWLAVLADLGVQCRPMAAVECGAAV